MNESPYQPQANARPRLSARPVHTYSIVARDPKTGEMAVAVQSHWFSVGSVVSWAEAGVGAIATQALVNVSLGPTGLGLLKQHRSAQEALDELLASDEGRDVRQLAIVDSRGRVAAHSGKNCIPEAGHIIGEGFAVQANMMLNDQVWPAMADSFRESTGPLPERVLASLKAAQEAGGDIRGKQSAAILVVRPESSGRIWEDRLIDLHVEDHPEPVEELHRLLGVFRAYQHMNEGDLAIEKGDTRAALAAYSAAEAMCPDNLEMQFWHAISLANLGMMADALPIFGKVFARDRNWAVLAERLVTVGLLKVSDDSLTAILSSGRRAGVG